MKEKVLAIIPARSGSKSVKDKNIKLLGGYPLIYYSIKDALNSKKIDRVIVSTDSTEYANIAKSYGAEVPFIRPSEISQDHSLDFEVFYHALNYLKETEDYIPDIVVHLRPTYPIRNVKDIDNMIQMLILNNDADSVRCIVPSKEIPYKMWTQSEDGFILPVVSEINEAFNMPRQQLPKTFYQNASIDVVRSKVILNEKSMSGRKIIGYKMGHNFDIDSSEDFKIADDYLSILYGKRRFVIDIDGVIAKFRYDLDYKCAEPDLEVIKLVNYLYLKGNNIILFTARGYKSGIDWSDVTKEQLKKWNVHYHELLFGKPNSDYYIDDKNLSIETIRKILFIEGIEKEAL